MNNDKNKIIGKKKYNYKKIFRQKNNDGFVCPCKECASYTGIGGGRRGLTHTTLKLKVVHVISFPWPVCLQSLTLHRTAASLGIFYCKLRSYCSSELANCLLPSHLSRSPSAQNFPLTFISILSILRMQASISSFTQSLSSTSSVWVTCFCSVFITSSDLFSVSARQFRDTAYEIGCISLKLLIM